MPTFLGQPKEGQLLVETAKVASKGADLHLVTPFKLLKMHRSAVEQTDPLKVHLLQEPSSILFLMLYTK